MDDPRIKTLSVHDPIVMEYCKRVAKAIMLEFPKREEGWDTDRIILGAALAVSTLVVASRDDTFLRSITLEQLAKAMRYWADVPEEKINAH